MMRARLLALALLMCTGGPCLSAPTWAQHYGAYKLLQSGTFAPLETLYAESAAVQEIGKSGSPEVELFFYALSLGARSNNNQAISDVELARRWVRALPDSLPAAILLGRATIAAIRDSASSTSWNAQDNLISDALKQLDKVKEQGKADSVWHSTSIRLMSLNGASPSQVVEQTKRHLQGPSNPGRRFFEDIVDALELKSSDARAPLRKVAVLAAQRTAQRDGLAMYAVAYLTAFHNAPSIRTDPFRPDVTDWKTLDAALSDLEKHYPYRQQINHHAALSCLARDKARAAELFTQLSQPDAMDPWIWKYYWQGDTTYNRCKTWALGKQLPA